MDNEIKETEVNTADTQLDDELMPDGFTEEGLEFVEEEAPPEDLDIRHSQKIIEAVLFAAGYPVSYERLAQVLSTTPGAVKSIVRHYIDEYNDDDGEIPRGIMLLMYDSSCQLCTREQYGTYIREALGIRRGGNLSQSSIETLAIIAYNEPVTRAFVETVRGVDSSYAVSSLCEKKLIEACGRLNVPGRPRLYRTTDNFLRVFGLTSLSDLPEVSVPTAGIQEKIEIADDDNTEAEDVHADEGEADSGE